LRNLKNLDKEEHSTFAEADFVAETKMDAKRWPVAWMDGAFVKRDYCESRFSLTIQATGPGALANAIKFYIDTVRKKYTFTIQQLCSTEPHSKEGGWDLGIPRVWMKTECAASWLKMRGSYMLILLDKLPEKPIFNRTFVITKEPPQLTQYDEKDSVRILLNADDLAELKIQKYLSLDPKQGKINLKKILPKEKLQALDRLIEKKGGDFHAKTLFSLKAFDAESLPSSAACRKEGDLLHWTHRRRPVLKPRFKKPDLDGKINIILILGTVAVTVIIVSSIIEPTGMLSFGKKIGDFFMEPVGNSALPNVALIGMCLAIGAILGLIYHRHANLTKKPINYYERVSLTNSVRS
jgi:hypothetical protein